MDEFIVFGDVAGQYKTLMELIKKAPDVIPVSVGDMNDRGPQSKEVLEFFMNHGKAVLGNHEHMMLDYIKDTQYYERNIWGGLINGAHTTLESFGIDWTLFSARSMHREQLYEQNKDLILWLSALPLYIEHDDYIITHAPINPSVPFEYLLQLGENIYSKHSAKSVLWNIGKTRRRKDEKFQIHGHLALKDAKFLNDKNGMYGVNVDSSRGGKLTCMHYPTFKIYEQNYI